MTFEPGQAFDLHCLAGSSMKDNQWRGATQHHKQPEGQQGGRQVMSSCARLPCQKPVPTMTGLS